jgi:hypothetical protein
VEAYVADDARRTINLVFKQNVALFSPAPRKSRDWSAQDLAEFYRVESALIQGGMRVVTDRGLSDEGDPWFVFCREHDGEPIAHFARIDGQYVIASPAYEGMTRGLDFRVMVQELIERHKLSLINNDRDKNSNIHIHPAALLIVLVGAAFFKTPSQANADELKKEVGHGQKGERSSAGLSLRFSPTTDRGVWSEANAEQVQKDQALVRHLWLVASAASLVVTSDESVHIPVVSNLIDRLLVEENPNIHAKSLVASNRRADAHEPAAPISFAPPSKADDASGYNNEGLERDVVLAIDWEETAASHAFSADLSVFPVAVVPLLGDISGLMPHSFPHKLNSSLLSNEFVGLYTVMSKELAGPYATIFALNQPSTDAQMANAAKTDGAAKSQAQSFDAGNHETTYVAYQSSAAIKNVALLGVVPQQTGSASSFLNDNKIFVTLGAPDKGVLLANVDTSSQHVIGGSKTSAATTTSQEDNTLSSPKTNTPESLSGSDFVKVLSEFIQEAQNVQVTVDHGYYVFEDFSGGPGVNSSKDSITVTFDDGSAISIVGQHQMLQDLVSHLV